MTFGHSTIKLLLLRWILIDPTQKCIYFYHLTKRRHRPWLASGRNIEFIGSKLTELAGHGRVSASSNCARCPTQHKHFEISLLPQSEQKRPSVSVPLYILEHSVWNLSKPVLTHFSRTHNYPYKYLWNVWIIYCEESRVQTPYRDQTGQVGIMFFWHVKSTACTCHTWSVSLLVCGQLWNRG